MVAGLADLEDLGLSGTSSFRGESDALQVLPAVRPRAHHKQQPSEAIIPHTRLDPPSSNNMDESDTDIMNGGFISRSQNTAAFKTAPQPLKAALKDKRPRITYQVELAYLGQAFHGWMRQPGSIPTVEGAVLAGIRSIIPQSVGRSAVASAGRTDKGVSALAQVDL